MSDDLARLVIGLPVAALFPCGIPGLRQHRLGAALLSAAYATILLAPAFPDWRAFLLVAATPATAFAVVSLGWRPVARSNQIAPPSPGEEALLRETVDVRAVMALAIGCAVVTAAAAGAADAVDAIGDVLTDDGVWIVASGLLATVFIGGLVIAALLAPFTVQLVEDDGVEKARGLARAGTYIGWFERALFYGFVVAGEPQAAAIALAAKSVARFPALQKHEEGFAEYFLIGSLASLSLAAAIAVGTRAALGLAPV